MKIILPAFLCVFLGSAAALAGVEGVVVQTDKGDVLGVRHGNINVFKGIPFAAPPVGSLRWRPPQPLSSWQGTQDATAFGPVCPQPTLRPFPDGVVVSEGCLNLNVWTPAGRREGEKLPVMVWIHGGGFRIGSGAIHKVFTPGRPMPMNDFSSFVSRGVVMVTLNYRMGLLGVFAHPLMSAQQAEEPLANYGLLDQIAALRWTQKNISAFGGDPENVTLFGQSAGGVSVNALMVSSLSAGLFHKAISQSGPGLIVGGRFLDRKNGDYESLETEGVSFALAHGIADDASAVQALRDLPVEELLGEDSWKIDAAPVIDGRVLRAGPEQLFAEGKQHDLPYMAGANSNDGSVFARDLSAYDAMLDAVPGDAMSAAYGDLSGQALKLRFVGDRMFVAPSWFLARQMNKVGAPGYYYHFSYVPVAMASTQPGAAHGAEMPFVFRNLAWREYPHDATEYERSLAESMSGYWVNFARSGDPNGTGLQPWPKNSSDRDATMVFGDTLQVVDDAFAAQLPLHLPAVEAALRKTTE